jgi:AraC-like DNA-binding protein
MYDPKGNSKDKTVDQTAFTEAEPPDHLRGIVHRYLDLHTNGTLDAPYRFHALPDACTYAVFDQNRRDIAGITRLQASSEELDLGTSFHFTNIRFLPGVWQGDRSGITYGLIEQPYTGALPMIDTNGTMKGQSFAGKQSALTTFVEHLIDAKLVIANPVTEQIFQHIDDIHTVADMAEIANLSTRQLQRNLKQTTGFSPHDFLKVLRLQQSLDGEPSLSYADQSHFIHSFRRATGYTPGQFAKKFDV